MATEVRPGPLSIPQCLQELPGHDSPAEDRWEAPTELSLSWLHSGGPSAKADTHRELIRTLRELKVHLPADKQAKGKASTLATLKYALRSVKQVKGRSALHLRSQLGSEVSGIPGVWTFWHSLLNQQKDP